jgi:hypothetical protein
MCSVVLTTTISVLIQLPCIYSRLDLLTFKPASATANWITTFWITFRCIWDLTQSLTGIQNYHRLIIVYRKHTVTSLIHTHNYIVVALLYRHVTKEYRCYFTLILYCLIYEYVYFYFDPL